MRDQNKRLFRGKTVGRELLDELHVAVAEHHVHPAGMQASRCLPAVVIGVSAFFGEKTDPTG